MESTATLNLIQTPISCTEPVVRYLPADLETPVSVYLKLAGDQPSFLLESVTGGENVARYSFIGVQPSAAYIFYGAVVQTVRFTPEPQVSPLQPLAPGENPLDFLRQMCNQKRQPVIPGLPRFSGGLAGFLGYEMVRFFEPCLDLQPHASLPDAIFLQADILVAYDHAFGRLALIGQPQPEAGLSTAAIEARLDAIEQRLAQPLPAAKPAAVAATPTPFIANQSQEAFCSAVQQAKEYIAAGDIFQVVLSQRMQRQTSAAPFDIYRSLRRLNPSPYMFYFDFGQVAGPEPLRLIGASPELHVRLEGQRAALRPIAGTRKRGQNPQEETRLEQDLLADPKERAEHVMLVDLGRNDLGRLCRYGTVRVTEQMVVERYSHVIHLVSHIEGELAVERDAFDLLASTFPAGTVSGAPKIRAMQIIRQLEPEGRGAYAGAVGYFGYDGNMDTCITIRTMVMRGQTVHLQSGAGIVADSIPENEYQETLNKLKGLAVAIEKAEAQS